MPIKNYAEEILEGDFLLERMLKCQSFYVLFIFLMESTPLCCDTIILAYTVYYRPTQQMFNNVIDKWLEI